MRRYKKDSQLTDLGISKSMEVAEELAGKVEMMITGGIEQSKMTRKVEMMITGGIEQSKMTGKVEMMITGGIEQSKMLDEVQLRVNQQTEVVKETFADMVKKTTEGQERVQQPEAMRTIMKDAPTQHDQENTDKERRHRNHTIYGVKESGKGEQLRREDEAYVKELFDNHLGLMNLNPKAITRLGKVWEGDESRIPLRVIYNNIEEKERVTSVLGNLQNAPDRFRKIRISNDYNPEEREEIKKIREEAKKTRDEEDDSYIFVVRGEPSAKNLRVVKLKKRWKTPQQ